MEKIKIRRLRYNEIFEIIKLHKDSIVPLWKKLKRPYSFKKIEDYIKENFNKEKFFVIDNGKIIACGSIAFDKFSSIKKAFIGMLLVARKEQGKGYGKGMVDFLENYARKRGVKELNLDVLIKNPAVKFYKHLGYKDYKLIMNKKL